MLSLRDPRMLSARNVMEDMWIDMDRFFERFDRSNSRDLRIDVQSKDDHLLITADVPGFKNDELEVTVENGILTIAGEKKSESKSEDNGFYLSERCEGRFNRRLRLPEGIDGSSVTAALSDGVLKLVLKFQEEAKPKRIAVKSS